MGTYMFGVFASARMGGTSLQVQRICRSGYVFCRLLFTIFSFLSLCFSLSCFFPLPVCFLSLFYLLSFPFLGGSGWLCWASFCSQGDYPSVTLDSSSVIYVGGDFHSFCPEILNLIFIFLIRRSGTLQRNASVAYSEVTSGRSTRLNSLKMDD